MAAGLVAIYGWNNARHDAAAELALEESVIELVGASEELIAKYKRDYIMANRYMGAYYTLTNEDFGKAKPFWEKILELSPEDEGSKNGLDYIKSKGG